MAGRHSACRASASVFGPLRSLAVGQCRRSMCGATKPATGTLAGRRPRSALGGRLPCAARRRGMGGQLGPEYRPSNTPAQLPSVADPRLLRCSALISDGPGPAARARLCGTIGACEEECQRHECPRHRTAAHSHATTVSAKPATGTLAGQSGDRAEQRSGCGSATEGSWAGVSEGLYPGPSCPPIPHPRAAQGSRPPRADRHLALAAQPAPGFDARLNERRLSNRSSDDRNGPIAACVSSALHKPPSGATSAAFIAVVCQALRMARRPRPQRRVTASPGA